MTVTQGKDALGVMTLDASGRIALPVVRWVVPLTDAVLGRQSNVDMHRYKDTLSGAADVTIVVIARRLKPDGGYPPDFRQTLGSREYTLRIRPVTGGSGPP